MKKHVAFGVGIRVVLCLCASVGAKELGFVEDFALASDRDAVLKKLVPGTDDYYYYYCVHAQNTGIWLGSTRCSWTGPNVTLRAHAFRKSVIDSQCCVTRLSLQRVWTPSGGDSSWSSITSGVMRVGTCRRTTRPNSIRN